MKPGNIGQNETKNVNQKTPKGMPINFKRKNNIIKNT